jgi:hypothetical protein
LNAVERAIDDRGGSLVVDYNTVLVTTIRRQESIK